MTGNRGQKDWSDSYILHQAMLLRSGYLVRRGFPVTNQIAVIQGLRSNVMARLNDRTYCVGGDPSQSVVWVTTQPQQMSGWMKLIQELDSKTTP